MSMRAGRRPLEPAQSDAAHFPPHQSATVRHDDAVRRDLDLDGREPFFPQPRRANPLPEWGAMLSNSRNGMLIAPQVALFPGLAIIFLVFGSNLFQDGLRRVLDTKLQDL